MNIIRFWKFEKWIFNFIKEHHYEFLKKLTEQGTGEGMFRYCEPGDGPTVLRDKLQELFDFVLSKYEKVLQTK